jgi:hypothetical protein
MAKTRTVKDPVQKGRITIGEARSAAREAKKYRSAVTGRYVTASNEKRKPKKK